MDQDTQSWLVGVPFDTNHGMPHERLRLSRRHKWELAHLTGIVMASTVFFLTPLLVSAPAPEPLDARFTAAEVANPELMQEPHSRPQTPVVDRLRTGSTQSSPVPDAVATSEVQAQRLTIPRRSTQVEPLRRTTTSVRPAVVRVVHGAASPSNLKESDRRRKGVPGGLVRVLVGSGRHRVQPFPRPGQ